MNTKPILNNLEIPPELEALQFERLLEIYLELGLTHAQAAAAAQADYLCLNIVAFRRRGSMDGSYLLIGQLRKAA